jgi:putative endonuclease
MKTKPTHQFFVYLLLCRDNTFYCGSTNDLEKRIHAHNNLKSAAKYTRGRRPVTLVYSEKLKSFAAMRKREGEIKKMSRSEKENLIK